MTGAHHLPSKACRYSPLAALPRGSPSKRGCLTHHACSILAQVGYVASWSATATHRRAQPHAPDPVLAFEQRVREALGLGEEAAADPSPLVRLEWPLFGILAKQPVQGA